MGSLDMVWQAILVAIDSHKIFERDRNARLLMRLEFRNINDHVGIQ